MSKPPKKDNTANVTVVDKTKFYRQSVLFPVSKTETQNPIESKSIYQIDLLLPEWNNKINDEIPWATITSPDETLLLDIGKNLATLNDYFGELFSAANSLPAATAAPTTKKDKNVATANVDIFSNKSHDDKGNLLPQIKRINNVNSSREFNTNILDSFDLSTHAFKFEQETNPHLCTAFKLVSMFASYSNIQKVHVHENIKNDDKFPSWQHIYPQTKTGEPCYNPSGVYFVRLFVSGKWRAIKVSHLIPVTPESKDTPVIPMSNLDLELWPIILSKAIYIAFNVCGLNGENQNISSSDATIRSLDFTRFAVHVLTGWQPCKVTNLIDAISIILS